MGTLLRELRCALRGLRHSPLFALAAVATLGLGVGVNTGMASVVDTVLIRPLPFTGAERLVRVYSTSADRPGALLNASPADYFDWTAQSRTLSSLAGFLRWSYTVTGEGAPQRIWGSWATANFFRTMDVAPILGRGFLPEEDRPTGDRVVILSYGLWQELFQGADSAVGKTLRLDEVDHQIVGVMPRGFEFPSDARLWTPMRVEASSFPRDARGMRLVARLAPGASLDQASTEMRTVAERLEREYPDTNRGWSVALVPLRETWVGGVERSLWLLQAAALIVLVIACSNVASLFLARAIDRRAEVTVRRALGAQRFAATTTLLAEGLLIGLAGAVLGLFIAWLGTSTLVSLSQAHENVSFLADRLHDIPRLEQVRIDGRSFGFALSLSLLCGLLMAFVAGYQRPRAPLSQWLGGAGKAAGRGRIGPRLRAALIVVEVALAFSLAVSCGLLLRHYSRLSAEPAGFDAAGVVSMEIHLPPKKYARDFQIQAYYSGLETQLASLPGVESVGQAWGLPLSGLTASSEFEIENRPRPAVGQEFRAAIQPVSPGYFRTLRIPLVSGRFFEAGDNAGSKPVALINQTLARRFFPGEDPVGKKIQFDAAYPNLGRLPAAWREIVGVVGDVRFRTLEKQPEPEMYFPYGQCSWWMASLAIRSSEGSASLYPALRERTWALDPDVPVTLRPLEEVVSRSLSQPRLNTVLWSCFAGMAALLALLGIFGVVSYTVSQRQRELGVRIAVGAQPRDLLGQVLRENFSWVAIGLGIGLVVAGVLARLLAKLVTQVSPADPWTYLSVSAGALVVTLLACYLPARRVSRVEPVQVLRAD